MHALWLMHVIMQCLTSCISEVTWWGLHYLAVGLDVVVEYHVILLNFLPYERTPTTHSGKVMPGSEVTQE